jgi:type III secretion system FlhB-like substrate exporter
MSHKETTRVAIALKYIDEERLAPTHRRGDGGDDENIC